MGAQPIVLKEGPNGIVLALPSYRLVIVVFSRTNMVIWNFRVEGFLSYVIFLNCVLVPW